MRTPTNRSVIPPRARLDTAILLSLPFPACIFDSISGIVFQSNSFFKQENSIPLLALLEKSGYRFLVENDIKILRHRIKLENKFTTRRLSYNEGQVKSVEINLSVISGHNLVLFFFTEVWTQETIFSKTTYIEELVQSISEGVGLIDENNILTFCNKSFASLFGKTENEIIGNNIANITDYPGHAILQAEIENLKVFQESNFELQISVTHDVEKFIFVHAIPRKNSDGNYSGAFFTLMDISDRVEMERELINAKDKALVADRLKSAFLANMSHEIRTPMNCIIGFSTMLKKTGLERKKRDQYLDIVISKGNQLMEILNNIIDISKIEENQIQLSNEECCLYDIFSELKDFYENELVKNNKADIQFLVNLEAIDKDLRFYADTARLQQIFSNLLSNAVKFTESGFIELGFNIKDCKELIFYVKDSGIGIDPDKHILIFERFRQIDESFTRSYGGNGLGLTICKGLIKLFGGKIWVESDGINGSTFYFSIPFHKASLKNEQNVHDLSISEKVYDWSGRKILIVEDDLTCYEFLSEVLLLTNCVFEHASSGTEALKRFSRTPFDLVLLDMQLPEVDGYQIAHAIRKTNPHIPIIAQTAHAMSDDKQKCINAGCNEYIAKPLHFEHLLETINSFLS